LLKLFTGFLKGDLEFFVQRTAMLLQGAGVGVWFIGFAVFPASKIDADQFVG
jgi:hypothetical protein